MTFNYTTLITDRTQSDVDRVKYLAQRIAKGTSTDAERAEYLTDLKGAYNTSDLNRVTAAMEYLKRLYGHYGYHVNYTPIYIERKKKSRLPAGYTEVEYIQSSGAQYVDTGFQPNQDTKVELRVSVTQTGSHTLFGTDIGWSANGFTLGCSFGHYGSNAQDFTGLNDGSLHDVVFDKNVISVDGTVKATLAAATFSMSTNMALFANNRSGSIEEHTEMRLDYLRIYSGEGLVRDYAPCINYNNEVGLYDLVNGQFYGNSGTGTFTAGDVVESASESDTLDPYTWYVSDIPTQAQMQTYLQNVVVLKNKTHEILSYYDAESQYPLPDAPADMVKLTYQEANDIEQILQSIENQLIYMSNHFYWYYSGEVYAGEI